MVQNPLKPVGDDLAQHTDQFVPSEIPQPSGSHLEEQLVAVTVRSRERRTRRVLSSSCVCEWLSSRRRWSRRPQLGRQRFGSAGYQPRFSGSSGIFGECKNPTVFNRDLRLIPKGCQTVAGGGAAETPGKIGAMQCISKRCQNTSIRCGKYFIASGIPLGCDSHSAPFRWSPLRCDHRLLSDIPSG